MSRPSMTRNTIGPGSADSIDTTASFTAADYFSPVTLVRDNEKVLIDGPNYYLTDAIASKAVNFMKDAASKSDPFFLYAAFTAPHWPLHALEEDIARYRGRYKDGWDALREERHKRQLSMGIVN